MQAFTQFIQEAFEKYHATLPGANNAYIAEMRKQAIQSFLQRELPDKNIEEWRHYPIDCLVEPEYHFCSTPPPYRPVEDVLECKIKEMQTSLFVLWNGWYMHHDQPLTVYPDGVIIGSLFAAIQQFPDIVFKYLSQQNLSEEDSLLALNEAFFNDGLFVYVPDNVKATPPVQLVNMIDSSQNLLIQNRNLLVLGKNASLMFVQCNDTILSGKTFINNVTEIALGENAQLNYVKLENKDAQSLLTDQVIVNQKSHSELISNVVTFNAGYLRNSVKVNLNEPFANAKLYGLYLLDKNQVADNQVVVRHNSPDCVSYQLYKGIMDDRAYANFNGHILVAKDAQRTSAFQTNNNIALTDDARITTKPFLEIYADDVQCSHGATIGQLDEEAMFYLRSRGICESNARMLLLYAFAKEAVSHVQVPAIKEQLNGMIRSRLRGELNDCSRCLLNCTDRKDFSFEINL